MIELTVLRPGTIRDLFSQKRSIPPSKRGYDPVGLPSLGVQCVHVQAETLSEGVEYVRCVNDAVSEGRRHGWLCEEHGQDPWIWSPRPYRDKDAEIVEGIVKHETRMLANTPREIVGNKANQTQIQFVKGVRMKNDVDAIDWE